jgi:hypothetical protein
MLILMKDLLIICQSSAIKCCSTPSFTVSKENVSRMKIDKIKSGKYQHYKNKKFYEVIGICRHSETHEEMVIYKALYHCESFGVDQVWVRSKELFLEHVNYKGCMVPRFKLIKLS